MAMQDDYGPSGRILDQDEVQSLIRDWSRLVALVGDRADVSETSLAQ